MPKKKYEPREPRGVDANGNYVTYIPPDRTVYLARFAGYRMLAFGRMQTLDYGAEIQVFQRWPNPPLWMARDCARRYLVPGSESARAEDCMRMVEATFVRQLTAWDTYTHNLFTDKIEKLGPKLVPAPVKTVRRRAARPVSPDLASVARGEAL
jgi:hypothetical protein